MSDPARSRRALALSVVGCLVVVVVFGLGPAIAVWLWWG